MKQLTRLAEQQVIAPIDAELGAFLARKAAGALSDVSEVQIVGMTGALLSAERARGNSCIDLERVAGRPAWDTNTLPPIPPLVKLRDVLTRSRLCTDGAEAAPLMLDGDRVYLYRYHAAETQLARAIRARVDAAHVDAQPSETVVALFRKLFDVGEGRPTDWQAVAAAAAMRNRLTVITGGPGTGKTTTVARVLAMLLAENPETRCALAAPTGKAAARLSDAIQIAAEQLPIDADLRDRLPRDGRTLHRLLGYNPRRDRFTFGAEDPLSEDVVIIDEASMVDLLMMDTLFAAIRPAARIILLGDQDQLASVEAGYVLGDICRAAEQSAAHHGPDFARWYATLSGQQLDAAQGDVPPLRDAVVRLQRSYRFERQPGIGALASALKEGNASRAAAVLDDPAYGDVRRRDSGWSVADLFEPVASTLDGYLATTDAAEALRLFNAFRVLTPLREGRQGVTGLNAAIERWLRERGVYTRSMWYSHRPILITANDPSSGLFNGDVGVALPSSGTSLVWFADGAGAVRSIAPARLPAHETAWAMTVHKAQGSEFDHVLLVLPDTDTPLLTRELLYTAVTRARVCVDIFGSRDVVLAAGDRAIQRSSGLAARLSP